MLPGNTGDLDHEMPKERKHEKQGKADEAPFSSSFPVFVFSSFRDPLPAVLPGGSTADSPKRVVVGTAHQLSGKARRLIQKTAAVAQPREDCGKWVGVPIGWVFGITLVARQHGRSCE
ncbi:MAG TPA: hypothetical protein VMY42_05515 [Thermoguttaceae bacterium]|nr:hypothetical protein [Thermoguttaceae bacterium]